MSKVASRIVRRAGVHQYRRRVPDDVRKLGAFNGREIFQISLRTRDPVVARLAAAKREVWFERECVIARGASVRPNPIDDGGGMVLSDVHLKALQDRHVAVSLAEDVRETNAAQNDTDLADWIEQRDAWLIPTYRADEHGNILDKEGADARRRIYEIDQVRHLVAPVVEWHAKAFGAVPGSADHSRIENTFIEAELKALAGRRELRPGVMFPSAYRPADASGPAIKTESTWTIRKLADRYLAVTPSGGSWRHKVDVGVALFEQFMRKPTPISGVTRDHVREFLELLAVCPQRSAMRFPGLALQDAIEANRSRKPRPFPVIGPNTIRDNHFAVLRVLFGYACGQLGAIPHDPTERLTITGSTKKGGRSAYFEVEELNALFKLPTFTGCRSENRTKLPGDMKLDDHQFWTPLIMLFTGARPSEIAQLASTDVKLKGEYPSIGILTEYDPGDPEDHPYVLAFKTENARRSVPLHPTLIELGFGRYVERMLASGQARLFPHWKASADPRKLYSGASWVRRFNDTSVPAVTSKHPKPSIYSLRHTFKTQMAVCRVPPQFQDKVMGHAGPRMDPTYLKTIPIRDLYDEVAKVTYPGLLLTHLKQ